MALCASSQQRVFAPLFSSEVHRDGLDGLSMMSSLRIGTVDSKRDRSAVHSISRGKWGPFPVPAKAIFKMNAAVDDSSSPFLDACIEPPCMHQVPELSFMDKESAEGEQTTEDHPPRKDGLFQWFRNAVASRTAQKEEMISNLKRYGVAGVLSYGLLNTLYYLGTFLFVWFYVAPSPGGLGFGAAAQRFLKVFATVWAGSQVTKLFRAAGALSLAPFVDRGLNWYTQRFNFKSRATAFSFLVGACVGLALLVFLVITTLWS